MLGEGKGKVQASMLLIIERKTVIVNQIEKNGVASSGHDAKISRHE